jgi:hypothetical protein
MLNGSIPEERPINSYLQMNLHNNRLSGEMPVIFSGLTITNLRLDFNVDLVTPSTKAATWTNYSNFKTASTPEYNINSTSTTIKYAATLPQDSGYMILNKDIHNDGHANFSLAVYNQQFPEYNIDVDGDDIVDLNIVITPYSIGRGGR